MKIVRNPDNPIVEPADIAPTREGLKVDGVFNAGVSEYNGEIILLLRVAESGISNSPDIVKVPVVGESGIELQTLSKRELSETLSFSDPRTIKERDGTIRYLTSLSHILVAKSRDGVNFQFDKRIMPEGPYEQWGIEDPRVSLIEGSYYINYTAVSPMGASVGLMKSDDFSLFQRMGIIFPPENKDVSLLSEKIGGLYYAYHRPVPKAIGSPDIWVASSPDLIHWGDHTHLLGVSEESYWENGRIGGGAPGIKTRDGWLHIYHAANRDDHYFLGAFLTPLDDPGTISKRLKKPLLAPEESYEREGFFNNVVFSCGAVERDGKLLIYYGAADSCIALAEVEVEQLLGELRSC